MLWQLEGWRQAKRASSNHYHLSLRQLNPNIPWFRLARILTVANKGKMASMGSRNDHQINHHPLILQARLESLSGHCSINMQNLDTLLYICG